MARWFSLSGLILVLGTASASAMATEYTLSAAQWAELRHSEDLVHVPSLAAAVRTWLAQPDARLIISHTDTDEGADWAVELAHNLVGLGVPSSAVRFVPNHEVRGDVLQISVSQEAKP